MGRPRVLHVIVGYGLRTYFVNAVRSVCSVAPQDDVLVVDNASPDPVLRAELTYLASQSDRMRLLLRSSNDLDLNGKVGSLYDAYREAFDLALGESFDYVHIVQGDMQTLWWDDDVIARAEQIFETWPRCVNVFTCLLTSNRSQSDAIEHLDGSLEPRLRHYGLTDTGLFHLGRWKELGLSFAQSETEHSARYLREGFSVPCHPWPTDAQIPWPAVMRGGRQDGREVICTEPFLLRPLGPPEVAQLKLQPWTWLEDICVPWGWACLTPMWTGDLSTTDYWAARSRDIRARGLRAGWPRWETRGLDKQGHSRWHPFRYQHRPSLARLCAVVPALEIVRRLRRKIEEVAFRGGAIVPRDGVAEPSQLHQQASRSAVRVSRTSLAVVLATYNGAAFIGEQLASLSSQSRPPDQLIVSDDGSSDATLDLVKRFAETADFEVQVVEGPRRGLGENFWSAAKLSDADMLAWCDQDDVWLPDKLQLCERALIEHDAELVSHSALVTDESLVPTGRRFPDYRSTRVLEPLTGDPWFVPSGFASVFRRQLLEDVPWSSRPRSQQTMEVTSHDHSISLLAFGSARRVELAPTLAKYRQHQSNAAGAPRVHGLDKVRFALGIPATQYENLASIAAEIVEYFELSGRDAKAAEDYFRRAQERCRRRSAIHQAGSAAEGVGKLVAALAHGDFRPRSYGGFGAQGFARDAAALVLGSRRTRV